MKKIYSSIVLIGATISILACTNVMEPADDSQESNAPVIYASHEGQNRSSISVNENGVGTIYWSPADDISIFYGASTPVLYTSTNLAPETTAAFTTSAIIGSTELASTNIWGLYPYNSSAVCNGSSITTTLPSTQYAIPGTFDDDLFITVAHSDNTNLRFYNVCGGIKFSLSRDDITTITFAGNNNEDLAGDITVSFVDGLPKGDVVSGIKTITLTPKDGGTFAANTDYYIIALPQSLTSGFTMTFETESLIGTFNYTTKAVTIKRSVFSKKSEIDGYASFISKPTVTNLSASGTANCYIVSSAGEYKFNASVKGNSNESVGSPASVEVLWETFGTSEVPSVGDLVYSVSLQDGFIHFSATDNKGNALIAVKDSEGTILWSWHIWCTDAPLEQEYKNDAGIMLDRNLGATGATIQHNESAGLLYQWGRKDPMIGSLTDSWMYNHTAFVGKGLEVVRADENTGTIDYAIKHPTTFISFSKPNTNYDWLYTGTKTCDNTRWTSIKTIYDPCPSGWRVPDGAGSSIWQIANNNFSVYNSYGFVYYKYSGVGSNNRAGVDCSEGFGNYGVFWYPVTGELQLVESPYNGLITNGDYGSYWTCTSLAADSYGYFLASSLGIRNVSPYLYLSSGFRYEGYAVRCQKE